MSDINSSLPVRTENPGDLEIKIVDGTNPLLALKVNADGSLNTTISATDLDIRDLSHTQDSIKVGDGTDFLAINADGSLNASVSGTVTVLATNLDIRDLVFATDKVDATGSEVSLSPATLSALESITVQNGAGAAAVNIQDGGNSLTVDAVDLDIRNLSAAQDSIAAHLKDATGNAFSSSNPLPVVTLESRGTGVNDYQEASNVNLNSSQNHDYTVTALKTLELTQVECSGSGMIKMEIQIESAAGSNSFSTKFLKFNSASFPNISITLKEPIAVPAGAKVRVIKTNRDKVPQSIYSTISGHEV